MPVSTRTPLSLASTLFSALLLALTACPADPGDTEGDETTGAPAECPVADSCEVSAADFCWYVADASAAHQIGEPYANLLQGMCRTSPACQTCWNLANYCVQLADDAATCETLAAECGCQAAAFGKL